MAGAPSDQEVVSLRGVPKKVLVVIAIILVLVVVGQLIFVIGKTNKSHPRPSPAVVVTHEQVTTPMSS